MSKETPGSVPAAFEYSHLTLINSKNPKYGSFQVSDNLGQPPAVARDKKSPDLFTQVQPYITSLQFNGWEVLTLTALNTITFMWTFRRQVHPK